MWIAMGGLMGLTTIVFVLGLLSARTSRKHRQEMHRKKAILEMQKRKAQTTRKSNHESDEATSTSNTEPAFAQFLAGAGMGQGRTH